MMYKHMFILLITGEFIFRKTLNSARILHYSEGEWISGLAIKTC